MFILDHISVEQFLEQSKEVRKILMDWWKPQRFDLFAWHIKGLDTIYVVQKYEEEDKNKYILPIGTYDAWNDIRECIPLFTECQLRKLIEDKTGKKIWISHNCGYSEGHVYIIQLGNDSTEFYKKHDQFAIVTEDLMQAFWQIVIELVRREVNKNLEGDTQL